jgi:hypothetical protein
VRTNPVEHRQPWRERIDQHNVTSNVAVGTALPVAAQRMITMARIKRIAENNVLHHVTQLALERSSLNPPAEITPKLAF